MNFPNLKKTIEKIKNYPWRDSAKSLKFLPRSLNVPEKLVVIISAIFALLFTGHIWYTGYLGSTKLIPNYGGQIREGIIGDSKDLDQNDSRLLKAGLTKYDNQKNIVGDLAQSWDINDAGKTYVFHLRPGFNAQDLSGEISAQGLWTDITIATPDDQTLTFTFKQPFSPFLNVSTKPIFNYGPYQITKEDKDSVEFQARSDYYGGRPYLDKITLVFFSSEAELEKAIKRGDVQSFALNSGTVSMNDAQKFQIDLPRNLDLFFNLVNKDLSDVKVRKALRENSSPGKALSLRLVTSNTAKNLEYAQKIKDAWGQVGVTVTLDIKDNITLQKTTIPKRDYDILLYGLDYGEDPDPYPFWHSSQMGEVGRNLSNFNNKQADKLLESARQELDPAKRQETYTQFQAILDSEIPMFVVEHQAMTYWVSDSVQGIDSIIGSSEADRFLDVGQWFIKTKRVRI